MKKHSLIGASLGTMIEYYDYAIFALFITVIMPMMTGQHSGASALTSGFIVMFISQLLRPVGGVFFGSLGDRLGRKHTLLYAILGISIATLLIGLLPGYAQIGALALILLTLLKSVQIFCFGGEYNGAGVYVVEHAKPHNAFFWGSVLTATTLLGALFASMVGSLLTLHAVPTWGWRVAFIGGGLFGMLGLWYRRKMIESPEFLNTKNQPTAFRQMFQSSWRSILVAAAIGAFSTVPFSTVIIFINPFLTTQGFLTTHQMMLLQMLIIAFAIIALVTSGYLADKFGGKKIMLTGTAIIAVFSLPCLMGLTHHNLTWIIIGQLTLILGNEMVLGPSNAYMTRSFTVRERYRGASLGFASGMALAGGLTPLIENSVFHLTHSFNWLFIWPCAVGIITFFALWKHHGNT